MCMEPERFDQYQLEHAVLHAMARGDMAIFHLPTSLSGDERHRFFETPLGIVAVVYSKADDATIVCTFEQWAQLAETSLKGGDPDTNIVTMTRNLIAAKIEARRA